MPLDKKLNWWIWFFKQILFPDWLPERVGWAHLAHSDPAQKIKCMERTYNVRNSCTISAQKATEDSQMSYINVRIRPLLNFPRPWKWYCKIAWLSRYFLNRRTLHDLYANRSVLLVCYKLHLKRKTEDGSSRAGRTNSKQLCLCHNKVKYLKKMSLSGLELLHILILKTLPWKRASRNKNTKRQIRSH